MTPKERQAVLRLAKTVRREFACALSGDGICECYPECRVDCSLHEDCQDVLYGADREYWRRLKLEARAKRAKRYAAEVRARKPIMQVTRKSSYD